MIRSLGNRIFQPCEELLAARAVEGRRVVRRALELEQRELERAGALLARRRGRREAPVKEHEHPGP